MEVLNFILFVIAVLVLFYSGGILVRTLTSLGRYFRLSEYVLSFILVAFATSLPELFVGINSAMQGAPLLSLGNIVGSNVLNISLVLGVAILFSGGLNTEKPIEKEDYILVSGVMLLPVFLLIDGSISKFDGGILMSVFFFHLLYLIKTSHIKDKIDSPISISARLIDPIKQSLMFIGGAGLLLLSSSFVVSYGVGMAEYFVLPLFLVGVLVAIGTTLPEVAFSFKSAHLRHSSMAIGNIFGSVTFNITFILGLVSLIYPIVVEDISGVVVGLFLAVIITGVIQLVSFVKGRLEPRIGVALIFTAIAFVIMESLLK